MSEHGPPLAARTQQRSPVELPSTLVVLDTDAYSRLYVRRSSEPGVQELRDRLVGRIVVIATQTRAELQAWPLLRNWGPHRARELAALLATTTTVPVSQDVINAYVALQVQCLVVGHALGQKQHVADRWVAATAVALDRPLLSLDTVYRGAPHLLMLEPREPE